MDLVRLLSKLSAIGGVQGSVTEEKKPDADGDGVPDWADKKPGKDDNESKSKANEDIFNVLKGLKAIQEESQEVNEAKCPECGHDPCNCDDHDHKDDKLDECGDMDTSPLTAMSDANGMPAGIVSIQPGGDAMEIGAQEPEQMQPEMPAQEAPTPRYTLTVQNGDSNLSMTTDVPDEIIHVMKLAGVPGKAEVKAAPAQPAGDQGQEKDVDEAWGNTPQATNEKEPRAYGDIRDWGMKGTGKGQEGSAARKPFGSGDNPMSETKMFEEYKQFKAGK